MDRRQFHWLRVMPMKVLSVNVGLPRIVQWKGKHVSTGIFKTPVPGRIRLRTLNFDGDGQADLSAHGGPNKAVYAYPVEHYAYWRHELSGMELPWGIFGENLTTEGLSDESTCTSSTLGHAAKQTIRTFISVI